MKSMLLASIHHWSVYCYRLCKAGRTGAGLADRLLAQTQEALSRQEMLGAPPVLLVNHALRPLLSRFLRRSLPQLVVLSNLELSDNRHIRMTATIGGK